MSTRKDAFPALTAALAEATLSLQELTSAQQRKDRVAALYADHKPRQPATSPKRAAAVSPRALSPEEAAALEERRAAAAERARVAEVTRRIERVYKRYAPHKLDRMASQLEKHEGKEEKLLRALVAKYGPEPE